MDTAVSNLLASTTDEFVSVLDGFVTNHLDVVISIALVIGVIYLLKKLVGKY